MCLYVYLDFALWRLKVPSSRSDFLHFRLVLGLSPVWADKCRLTFEAWLNNFLHSVNMWRFSPLHVLDKVEMFHCEIIALLGLICLFPSMSINMVFSIFSDFSCWCILSGMPFEDAFENTHWRKFNQMKPMCILTGRQFEQTFENTQWRKSKKSAASVTMHLPVKMFSGYIWKRTVEKKPNKCNQCNFAAVQVGDLRRYFKRHSGEKSTKCNLCDFVTSRAYVLRIHLKINAASVTLHCLWQAIWGDTT